MQVSRLGFGCGGLSGIYNAPLSHEEGCSIIKEIFNKGVTFFDTSDLYGDNHDNEIMVGKVIHYPTNSFFFNFLLILSGKSTYALERVLYCSNLISQLTHK